MVTEEGSTDSLGPTTRGGEGGCGVVTLGGPYHTPKDGGQVRSRDPRPFHTLKEGVES